MFIILFLCLVSAKCGLFWQYQRSTANMYDNWVRRWNLLGFESLAGEMSCNDMEMFHQCNRVQQKIDLLSIETELGCAEHIGCKYEPPGNGRWWCQNMDSYDKCMLGLSIIRNHTNSNNSNNNSNVNCTFAVTRTDDYVVINYRQAPIKTSAPTSAPTPAPTLAPTEYIVTEVARVPTPRPVSSACSITNAIFTSLIFCIIFL